LLNAEAALRDGVLPLICGTTLTTDAESEGETDGALDRAIDLPNAGDMKPDSLSPILLSGRGGYTVPLVLEVICDLDVGDIGGERGAISILLLGD